MPCIPAHYIGYENILDVRTRLQGGTMVNIEVQIRNQDNMDKRSLYYWSREFTLGIKEGQDYKELPNTIAINIINFRFLDTENFHTVFRLREDKDIVNDPLDRWLTWLDEQSPPELIAAKNRR